MDQKPREKFSIVKRINSVTHAFRGLCLFFEKCHNGQAYIFFTVLVIYLGIILHITTTEWLILVLTMGFVFVAEIFNSAFEVDIDLTSPTYHPYAKDAKDLAAGAVALAVFVSGVIGMIIFLPKILSVLCL